MFLLGMVLILFGLFGLYASQSEAAGTLGLVGFLVAFLGTALAAGASWAQTFIAPLLATEAPNFSKRNPSGSYCRSPRSPSDGCCSAWLRYAPASTRVGL